jgi:hypothetical protein
MKQLKITTGVAAALLAAGCGQGEEADNGWTADRDTAVCVDQQGNRVPDGQCPQQRQAVAGGHVSPFLWYYLGRQSAVPYYGERVVGGSFVPTGGHSYFRAPAAMTGTRSGSIVRGGFGGSAHGGVGE